ncbi:MAG: alpha/beta fold hydrolase [Actinocatenispora sp.]
MTLARARHGDIELAYETVGPPTGEPMLLILGVAAQLVAWPDDFCAMLVEHGFRPARYDGRDSGLSTHLHDRGRPSRPALLFRRPSAAAYTLADLADDAVAVLDALGWPSAHLLGVSQGGMVAQAVATRHPDRVRSLTSISSTPSARIGGPSAGTLIRLLRLASHGPVSSADQMAQHLVDVDRLLCGQYPQDEEWLREVGRRTVERGHDQAGVERQSAAFQCSGDRRAELRGLRVPTLVVHGAEDRLVRPVGGRATADAVPGARLVVHPGMGHGLPRQLWAEVVDEIVALTRTTSRTAE